MASIALDDATGSTVMPGDIAGDAGLDPRDACRLLLTIAGSGEMGDCLTCNTPPPLVTKGFSG